MPESMTLDAGSIVLMILRWFHYIFGIAWIGHLYFFNFVNVPFAKTLDADGKKKVVSQLMPRALWWFRWGATITLFTGWVYLVGKVHMNHWGWAEVMGSYWGQWILTGALLGTIMWYNVWFIIWPIQKKVITAVKNGTAPDAAEVRKAFLASRTNTYLSLPMLFCMGAASHFPQYNALTMFVVTVVSIVITWHLVEKVAPKVGSNF